jgi:predicted nucleotidyltransferase
MIADLQLDKNISTHIENFVGEARKYLSSDLDSVILFGSAAEGRLRRHSDVNLIIVLNDFEVQKINQFREPYRIAHAAIKLNVMLLLKSEISLAADAFALKFADILGRHKVLFGEDPFKILRISRESQIARLKQTLLNLTLRIRERYVLISLREEQLIHVNNELSGPLRTIAATYLSLTGQPENSPKAALAKLIQDLNDAKYNKIPEIISRSREKDFLEPHEGSENLIANLDLLKNLYQLAERL